MENGKLFQRAELRSYHQKGSKATARTPLRNKEQQAMWMESQLQSSRHPLLKSWRKARTSANCPERPVHKVEH